VIEANGLEEFEPSIGFLKKKNPILIGENVELEIASFRNLEIFAIAVS